IEAPRMAKHANKNRQVETGQRILFDGQTDPATGEEIPLPATNGTVPAIRQGKPSMAPPDVQAIQDLLWKEARWALPATESFTDDAAFERHLAEQLPQNSPTTRIRYAQTLTRWFFPDGLRGLAPRVWKHYRDQVLGDEILRYLYLQAEPMAGAVVAEALLPIAENAVIPGSYLPHFLPARFAANTPAKTVQRLKTNLRKLGFLVRGKGGRDTVRLPVHSTTSFLIVLHYLFARRQGGAVEFRTLAADPFWKYLGFKTEDQLRTILKD